MHRHFAYDVFANNEMLGEEKSSFCVGSTRLQFAASRVIFAAALIIAFISEWFFDRFTCKPAGTTASILIGRNFELRDFELLGVDCAIV